MDCSPPGSSVHVSRQAYWSRLPFPPPRYLPDPGIKPASPALAGRLLPTVPPGKSGFFFLRLIFNGCAGRTESMRLEGILPMVDISRIKENAYRSRCSWLSGSGLGSVKLGEHNSSSIPTFVCLSAGLHIGKFITYFII